MGLDAHVISDDECPNHSHTATTETPPLIKLAPKSWRSECGKWPCGTRLRGGVSRSVVPVPHPGDLPELAAGSAESNSERRTCSTGGYFTTTGVAGETFALLR